MFVIYERAVYHQRRIMSANLDVIEYDGTGRSGKGTVVNHLGETYEGVATDETGADYRAVTRGLIMLETIKVGMPSERVRQQLTRITLNELSDMAANRRAIVEQYGLSSLYEPDVAELVSRVASVPHVRTAVKLGFERRVKQVRDDGNYHTLVIDGRHLSPVIEGIDGADLVLRTHVSCDPLEAARRECARRGVKVASPDGQAILESIQQRNNDDARRLIDPVKPDVDAIEYGYDHKEQRTEAPLEPIPRPVIKLGVGILAVTTRRQVHFNTTYFPKDTMLAAASQMFEEARNTPRTTA